MVEPNVKRMEQVIVPLFESMGRAATELCQRYSTEDLAVIHDFTAKACAMAIEEARKLRAAEPPGGRTKGVNVARRRIASMRRVK